MKKTYIKPENTVVMIHTESIIAQSDLTEGPGNRGDLVEGREVIQDPDPWEDEW